MSGKQYSPCIGICSTTVGDTVCRGCKRTVKEVAEWNGMTDKERDVIWVRLEKEGIKRGVRRGIL